MAGEWVVMSWCVVQRASRRADDVAKLETSESYYHSLVRDNDSDDVGRYEGVDQTGRRETTHMSWDEVPHDTIHHLLNFIDVSRFCADA